MASSVTDPTTRFDSIKDAIGAIQEVSRKLEALETALTQNSNVDTEDLEEFIREQYREIDSALEFLEKNKEEVRAESEDVTKAITKAIKSAVQSAKQG